MQLASVLSSVIPVVGGAAGGLGGQDDALLDHVQVQVFAPIVVVHYRSALGNKMPITQPS